MAAIEQEIDVRGWRDHPVVATVNAKRTDASGVESRPRKDGAAHGADEPRLTVGEHDAKIASSLSDFVRQAAEQTGYACLGGDEFGKTSLRGGFLGRSFSRPVGCVYVGRHCPDLRSGGLDHGFEDVEALEVVGAAHQRPFQRHLRQSAQ